MGGGRTMKIVFFGTPYYVITILEALHKTFKEKSGESPIAAVVTKAPQPVGRKQVLTYSEVDTWAHKKGIPKTFDATELISSNIKADIGILASYGALIPKEVMDYFSYGILVIHPSLLPEFRWGSPVQAAIVTGVKTTGVSIIKMDEKWDHGPIVTQFKEDILPEDSYGALRDRLFDRSAEVLIQAIPAYIKGKIKLKKQDEKKATFAKIIKKDDAFIPPGYLDAATKGLPFNDTWKVDFIKDYETEVTPKTLERFIRAMDPSPIAWTYVKLGISVKPKKQISRLKILKAHADSEKLIFDEVQIEGKNPVSWEQFKKGYPNMTFSS